MFLCSMKSEKYDYIQFNTLLRFIEMSYMKFICNDNSSTSIDNGRPTTCRGTVKYTGLPCKNKPKDINFFCHQHYTQSVKYAETHSWSLLSRTENGREILTKVDGIHTGAILTSTNAFK